jgi:8-hydroxy-5-deazaflavin:NADPH oxidoreductase
MSHGGEMKIAMLGGTGPAGMALSARLAAVGYDVAVGSRSKYRALEVIDSLQAKWPSFALQLSAHTNEEAAALGDVVIIATPWDSTTTMAMSVSAHLDGKVVVSMANALAKVGSEFEPLVPPRGSVAASVQAMVPKARVAAAFHHLPARELADIEHPIESDVLICSDHQSATDLVSEITARIPGCRPLDSGSLANATTIEAFTAVLLQLNMRYKTRSALRLTGISLPASGRAAGAPGASGSKGAKPSAE